MTGIIDDRGQTFLKASFRALRGDVNQKPDISIVIPVNAQGDLQNAVALLNDIALYKGQSCLEVFLVVNNYSPDELPEAIGFFENLGVTVISIPNVRRPGEGVPFSARMPGVIAASTEAVILFDADCRIIDSTDLIDWYVAQFETGADIAYTHVDYFDLGNHWSIRVRIVAHYLSRWFKRVCLGIPTARGSNYAVNRALMLELYNRGLLADDMNVGSAFRSVRANVAYSNAPRLRVLTSGRMFTPRGPGQVMRYWRYRFLFNMRVLPVGPDAAERTGRDKDPDRRYVDNKQIS